MTIVANNRRDLTLGIFIVGFVYFGSTIAQEPNDIENGVPVLNADSSVGTNQNVVDKISNDYRDFLGENAEAVVTGLRTGNEITLTTTDPGGTTTTSFTPPTGKMGYGNVSHSIGLAREQLSQYGITEPTADELQAALIGGDISTQSGGTATIDGVLTLRSEGMGWGEIAQEYGVKLGPVVSSVKSGKEHTVVTTHDQTGTKAQTKGNQMKSQSESYKGYGKGIVTGSGDHAADYAKPAKVKTSQGKSHAYGRGIVTAAGGSVGGANSSKGILKATSGKNGHAYGHGVVTAAGTASSAAGVSPGKKGRGLAKGHSK